MNYLIIDILPLIEAEAKRRTANRNDQKELVQITVLKCYDYEALVKTMYAEGNLKYWLYVVMRNELKKITCTAIENHCEQEQTDEVEPIYKLKEFYRFLNFYERLWLRAYIEYGGNYKEISRHKNINRREVSERIRYIIEKCKQLKHTLQ